MAWRFEVYADAGGNHRWRCEAENGENVAGSGEAFDSRSNAERAAENVKANAANADWSYEVYADAGGNHRWRLLAANGRNVASSGESFASESNARRAADGFKANAGSATGP